MDAFDFFVVVLPELLGFAAALAVTAVAARGIVKVVLRYRRGKDREQLAEQREELVRLRLYQSTAQAVLPHLIVYVPPDAPLFLVQQINQLTGDPTK